VLYAWIIGLLFNRRGGSTMSVQINVTYDELNERLDLVEEVEIGPGDSVEWVFSSVPAGLLPFVHFPSEVDLEGQQFGPFQYLEPSPTGVVALGNNGKARHYEYIVLLLDTHGARATSTGSHRIVNSSTMEDTSPDATVHYDPEQNLVAVHPPVLHLQPGRTAIWYITGVPLGHFVTFHFDGFPKPMTGPFLSFSMSRGFNRSWLANGADFSGALAGQSQVMYHVRVRNAQGIVVGSGDPVIDPLGSPPNG
jgi:plastocyanin